MQLKTLQPCEAKAWEPAAFELPTEEQTFQLWYPMFLMSGVGMLYVAGPKFRGYLQSFEPGEFEAGEPQATLTVSVSNEPA